MQDEHVGHGLAGRQHRQHPRDVVVPQVVLRPPRLMVVEARREVALAAPAQGVRRQVLADQVDAQDELPLGDPPQVVEADVPAAAPEHLAEDARAAELGGHAGGLLDEDGAAQAAAQVVDAWNVHVFIMRHRGADVLHLVQQRVLGHQVAGQLEVVAVAPLVHRHRPGQEEQPRRGLVEVEADLAAARPPGRTVPAGGPAVRSGRRGGRTGAVPATTGAVAAAGVLRLVGEDAGDGAAELAADRLAVHLVRLLQELLGGVAIEDIDIFPGPVEEMDGGLARLSGRPQTAAARPGGGTNVAALGVLLGEEHRHGALRGFPLRRLDFLEREVLLAVDLAAGVDAAGGGAARPAVLVVEPRSDAGVRAFVDGGPDGLHPLRPQVRRLETGPGVHEMAAQAAPRHLADLPPDLLRVDPVVPGPERGGAVSRPSWPASLKRRSRSIVEPPRSACLSRGGSLTQRERNRVLGSARGVARQVRDPPR